MFHLRLKEGELPIHVLWIGCHCVVFAERKSTRIFHENKIFSVIKMHGYVENLKSFLLNHKSIYSFVPPPVCNLCGENVLKASLSDELKQLQIYFEDNARLISLSG